jgi:hypothetical protein
MRKGIGLIIKGVMVLVLVVGLVYAGACVYSNFFAKDGKPELPSADKAAYAIQVQSTGQVLFSNKIDDKGQLITLHGFWELANTKFQYRKGDLILDEKLFGQIKVSRRQP